MALTLPFTDPFFGDMERTLRNMLGPGVTGGAMGFPTAGLPTAVATHAFDVIETDNEYKCITDAPGMTPDDVHVELNGDYLVISGEKRRERKAEAERAGMRTHRSERTFTRFSRSFILPDDAEPDKIAARMDNGVLTVEIPKVPKESRRTEPKRIKVQPAVGGGQGGGVDVTTSAAEPAGAPASGPVPEGVAMT